MLWFTTSAWLIFKTCNYGINYKNDKKQNRKWTRVQEETNRSQRRKLFTWKRN